MNKTAPTIIPASEEVYDKYTDAVGNFHWTGTKSGAHTIPAQEPPMWRVVSWHLWKRRRPRFKEG